MTSLPGLSTFEVTAPSSGGGTNVLRVEWDPTARTLAVDVGVPEGVIAEDAGFDVILTRVEARAFSDWLQRVIL